MTMRGLEVLASDGVKEIANDGCHFGTDPPDGCH
jgi:hypothetical protein